MKNNGNIHIAIDMMSGDFGLDATIPAALMALAMDPELFLILVGDGTQIEQRLVAQQSITKETIPQARIKVVHSTQIVAMDELPTVALRRKPDSSMRVALGLVKNGNAQACVSAGNTGALMVIAKYILRTLPGIDRPAILYPMPSKDRVVSVLDLGANLDCSAEQLFQFAVMGSVLVSALENKVRPSIGLLNVGSEAIKGTEAIKTASKLISEATELNYVGFVEGDDIYKGTVDLVVCDGFVGNVVLKASEGLAKMMSGLIRKEFNRSLFTKLMAVCAMVPLLRVRKRVDHRRYNGAVLLSLRGCVIKSHGSADRFAFGFALERAYEASKNHMVERIAAAFVVETTE